MEAIEAFWTWWIEQGRDSLTEAIRTGEATDLPEQISGFFSEIHPDLQWQLTPGAIALHALTLTPDGDPELRGITELWLRTGPDSDEAWEFHAARHPIEGPVEAAGLVLDPADVIFTFEYDDLYEQIDLVLDHDVFVDAERDVALEAAFAAIEATIGEDNVERWVGIVEISDSQLDGRSLHELPSIISRFEPTVTGDRWEEIETTDVSGWEEHLRINRAIKSIDHLGHNIHLEVRIEVEEYDRLGLPSAAETMALEQLATSLAEKLGTHALAIAVDTVNRHRSLHYYVDDVETVEETVDAWIEDRADRSIDAMFMVDPAWNNAHRWD